MFEIVLSSSSNSVDKAIDEYTNPSSFSGSSDSNSSGSGSGSSSEGNTMEEYESDVPGLPLEVVQEGLRTRSQLGSKAGTSSPSSTVKGQFPSNTSLHKTCIETINLHTLGLN